MTTTYDRMRAAADVFETDSHYSGSDEQRRRAMYAAQLRADAYRLEAVEKWARDPCSAPTVAVLRYLADRIRGEAT